MAWSKRIRDVVKKSVAPKAVGRRSSSLFALNNCINERGKIHVTQCALQESHLETQNRKRGGQAAFCSESFTEINAQCAGGRLCGRKDEWYLGVWSEYVEERDLYESAHGSGSYIHKCF